MAIRTVPDGTEDADLFGTGLPGFTSGDAGSLEPATIVSHFVMNHYQEELARAVEGSGQVLETYASSGAAQLAQDEGSMIYNQLDIALREACRVVVPADDAAFGVLYGLRFTTSGASLDVTLGAGELMESGRRYTITDTKLSDVGFDAWTLSATMDTYFYIAKINPSGGFNFEDTVHVERLEVAVGASQPSAPTDTLLFARLTTDATGVTSFLYYNHGPLLMNEQNVGLRLRSSNGVTQEGELLPFNTSNIDLGMRENPETTSSPSSFSSFRDVVSRQRTLVPTAFPVASNGYSETYSRGSFTLGGGATTAISLYDEDDFTDGTVVKVVAHATAHDTLDATDSYAAIARFMVRRESGSWNLDNSGADDPEWEHGAGAIAAGVTVFPQITSGNLNLLLTGHSGGSDIMRWYVRFEVDIITPLTDNP